MCPQYAADRLINQSPIQLSPIQRVAIHHEPAVRNSGDYSSALCMPGLPGFQAAMRPLHSAVQRLHPVRLSLPPPPPLILGIAVSTDHYRVPVLIRDNALLGSELCAIIRTAVRSESKSDRPTIPWSLQSQVS